MTHTLTIADTTATAGYGPLGHGTWRVSCTCGYAVTTRDGGRNVAAMTARDHRDHAEGFHARPVHGCRECGR